MTGVNADTAADTTVPPVMPDCPGPLTDQQLYTKIGGIKDQIELQNSIFKNCHKTKQFVWTLQEEGTQASNPIAFKGNGRIISKDYKLKIKTELCRQWIDKGECSYGTQCAFAHGEHELQKKKHVASMYKTRPCTQFHDQLFCPYGARCQFIHSQKSR